MKLTKATTELICELEYIIGNQCYNPNSLNGYTLEEGCEFRYPVYYVDKDGDDTRTKGRIRDIDKSQINAIRYKFGSNHLYIGNGILKVLELLESKYGLDFNELTKSVPKESPDTNAPAKLKIKRVFLK